MNTNVFQSTPTHTIVTSNKLFGNVSNPGIDIEVVNLSDEEEKLFSVEEVCEIEVVNPEDYLSDSNIEDQKSFKPITFNNPTNIRKQFLTPEQLEFKRAKKREYQRRYMIKRRMREKLAKIETKIVQMAMSNSIPDTKEEVQQVQEEKPKIIKKVPAKHNKPKNQRYVESNWDEHLISAVIKASKTKTRSGRNLNVVQRYLT